MNMRRSCMVLLLGASAAILHASSTGTTVAALRLRDEVGTPPQTYFID